MRISDWSSDVCSSDLLGGVEGDVGSKRRLAHAGAPGEDQQVRMMEAAGLGVDALEPGCDAGKAAARVQGLFRHLHGHFRCLRKGLDRSLRSEEHTSELQSLMRTSYAVFCLKTKNHLSKQTQPTITKPP